jgi:thiamine biosynthesis lipoprotein
MIFLAVYLPAQIKADEMVEKTALLMGTVVEIKVPLPTGSARREVEPKVEKALEEVRRIENLFSVFVEESEVSKINRLKKGDILKIDEEVFGLIEKAVGFSSATNGAFDITVKPLVDLWSAAKEKSSLPSDEEVRAVAEKVGSADIILDKAAGTIAFGKDGMAIDLGAIAKGYATDMAIKSLKENGIKDAIVNCGGDMYCLGRRSADEQWKVGIRDPRNKDKLFLELRLEDKAIDTSGDYEKFYIVNGKRYSHIIDPRSGYPVGDEVASASVITGDSVTADALATALCVLGRNGLNALDAIGGADAVIIFVEKGKLRADMSDGLKRRYHATEAAKAR